MSKLVQERYEAYWNSRTNTIIVNPIGDWIYEAQPYWVVHGNTAREDIKYAAGYGVTKELAKKNCEQNRDHVIAIRGAIDNHAEINGL